MRHSAIALRYCISASRMANLAPVFCCQLSYEGYLHVGITSLSPNCLEEYNFFVNALHHSNSKVQLSLDTTSSGITKSVI